MKKVLEEFTGILGIGYLFALGLFFIVDSMYKIHDNVNYVAGLKTWNILASIPLLMVAYILGLIVIQASELVIPNILFPNIQKGFNRLLPKMIEKNSELLNNRYMEVFQNKRILNGGFVSFLIVGIGAYMDGNVYSGNAEIFGFVGLCGALATAIICPLISVRIQSQFMKEIEKMS